MKFSPVWDSLSTAAALLPMASGLPPLGLIGTGFKKAFISEDSSFGTRFLVGLAATIASGGAGLIPYLLAEPGQEAKKDVADIRSNVTATHLND